MISEHPMRSTGIPLGRGLFMLALLLATWAPITFFLAVGSLSKPGGGLEAIKAALLLVGGIHVAATLILYVDRTFLPSVLDNKARYVYAPLATIVGAGVLFALGGRGVQVAAYLVLWAWQTYHYGRQNVGVYAFAGIAGGWRPLPLERRVLDLVAICAILGTFEVLAKEAASPALYPLFDGLYRLGTVAFLGTLAFSLYVCLRHRREFSWSRGVFFFTLVLFFAPMFMSTNVDVAFFSYAVAHGAQYLMFMTAASVGLAARGGRRGIALPMVVPAVLLVGFGVLGSRADDLKALALAGSSPWLGTVADFLIGTVLGTTIAHFIVDAEAWKLSRPAARRYVTERFRFLFEAAAPRVAAAPAAVRVPTA
jgi:hypothetical protein